jgi:predicted O-methyltransferase YrrM
MNYRFAHHDALAAVCQQTKPTSYLEIGVWRGDSLAVVLDNCTPVRLALCDHWRGTFELGYTGHGHIEALLRQKKYGGAVQYLDGNSRDLVPSLTWSFDLILVDGDHTEYGAKTDLANCWLRLEPGGTLVFDDLTHLPHMLATFEEFAELHKHDGDVLRIELNKRDGAGVIRKRIL